MSEQQVEAVRSDEEQQAPVTVVGEEPDTSRGSVRPITVVGNPVLHHPCETVAEFGAELSALVDDMFVTMYGADGVGLAANQIGVAQRVFVYDCPDDEETRHLGYVVNPRLVQADGVVLRGPEGCLSRSEEHTSELQTPA